MLRSLRNHRTSFVSKKKNRFAIAVLLLGIVALIPLPGCPGLLIWQEITCWDNAWSAWQAEVENWPDLSVRIVNNTDATARVVLTPAGIWTPECDLWFVDASADDPNYQQADEQALLVAAHGTVTGTVKCGELIAVTVRAPYDLSDDGSYYNYYNYDYGLYLDPGNVTLSGVGAAAEDGFSGDTVALIRYVRQVEDGLDCANDTLVITIQTLGTARVVDPETGAIIASATPGTGVVSLE
jgi:hypothetical protein